MTYILDAMLQAELERQSPLVPGLSTVQVLPRLPRPRRRRTPLVAGAVSVLVALALAGIWLLPPGKDTPPAGPVEIVAPGATAPNGPALVKLAEPPAAPPAEAPASAAPAVPAPPPETVPEPAAAEPSPPPAETTAPRRHGPRTQAHPRPRTVVAVPGKRVYRPAELPPELRRVADSLRVAGFAWSEDSRERLVIINNRALREGEEVARGLRVEHIVGDGVVFSLKGYRFRKGPT